MGLCSPGHATTSGLPNVACKNKKRTCILQYIYIVWFGHGNLNVLYSPAHFTLFTTTTGGLEILPLANFCQGAVCPRDP